MGEVYLAYDAVHQRVVALKLLLESLSSEPDYRARFEREARIAAGLREQHIIPIHRFGEIDNRLFIDMRLVEGEDLARLLGREGALEPRRAVTILRQVASALDAAHRAGLVHRDVKPANVLIARDAADAPDAVYLADFGIARETAGTGITATGVAVGTPAYMAPERFTGASVDHRADVYALGCILYEMLAGRPPFDGAGVAPLFFQHLNAPPPLLSAARSDLPRAFDQVVDTSMAKEPHARYQSAGELAAHAEAALGATAITPRRAVARLPSDDRPTAGPTTVDVPPPAAVAPRAGASDAATDVVPAPSAGSTRRRRWPWFAGGGVAAAAAAAVIFLGGTPAPPAPVDLTLESAGATGEDAFTPDFRAGPNGPSGGSSLPAGVVDVGAVSGATEGVYRATKGGSPCDRDGLSAFFTQNPSIANLWVRAVAGDPVLAMTDAFKSVSATTLPGYLAGLTPVLLRADTRVTAFSLTAGTVTARQAVLQAGTAVLIDERGLPRLRCAGGSPLANPVPNAPTANRVGAPWPGFDLRAAVVMTPAANVIRQFGLVGPTGTTTFRRPAGSVGPQDIDQVPQTALVEGIYEIRGDQVECVGISNCGSNPSRTLAITVQLRNCSPTLCVISAPKGFWSGEFPFTAVDGRWQGVGPTGSSVAANRCKEGPNPTTTIALSLTPDKIAVAADGVWRVNALTGRIRRNSDAFATCKKATQLWTVTADRST
jgi:hypothetical protein